MSLHPIGQLNTIFGQFAATGYSDLHANYVAEILVEV